MDMESHPINRYVTSSRSVDILKLICYEGGQDLKSELRSKLVPERMLMVLPATALLLL